MREPKSELKRYLGQTLTTANELENSFTTMGVILRTSKEKKLDWNFFFKNSNNQTCQTEKSSFSCTSKMKMIYNH